MGRCPVKVSTIKRREKKKELTAQERNVTKRNINFPFPSQPFSQRGDDIKYYTVDLSLLSERKEK